MTLPAARRRPVRLTRYRVLLLLVGTHVLLGLLEPLRFSGTLLCSLLVRGATRSTSCSWQTGFLVRARAAGQAQRLARPSARVLVAHLGRPCGCLRLLPLPAQRPRDAHSRLGAELIKPGSILLAFHEFRASLDACRAVPFCHSMYLLGVVTPCGVQL